MDDHQEDLLVKEAVKKMTTAKKVESTAKSGDIDTIIELEPIVEDEAVVILINN